MATLFIALTASFALVAIAIVFQLLRHRQSAARLKGLELRPNCLLTRYPIAFLSGRRSVFRLLDYWNDVPAYLHEHGYEVLVLDPVGQGHTRTQSLLNALNALPGPCHLIADSSSDDEMNWLANSKHTKINSLTLIRNGHSRQVPVKNRMGLNVADLKPLGSAIEVFDVAEEMAKSRDSQRGVSFQRTSTFGWTSDLTTTIALLLLKAHNLILILSYRQKRLVDPLEIAEFRHQNGWFLESLFLDLAISLAERDAQWCD